MPSTKTHHMHFAPLQPKTSRHSHTHAPHWPSSSTNEAHTQRWRSPQAPVHVKDQFPNPWTCQSGHRTRVSRNIVKAKHAKECERCIVSKSRSVPANQRNQNGSVQMSAILQKHCVDGYSERDDFGTHSLALNAFVAAQTTSLIILDVEL